MIHNVVQNREPFPSVISQTRVREILARILLTDRLGHAYLFLGKEGSGALPLAIELARVLNCPHGHEQAIYGCDCHSCHSIKSWTHPNIMAVFPVTSATGEKGQEKEKKGEKKTSAKQEKADSAYQGYMEIVQTLATSPYLPTRIEGTGKILIDQIREVRNSLSLAMDREGVRCVIVHPADRMNEAASNSLLKLLEEPPDKCCLILTAESSRDLLPTIISRCQPLQLTDLTYKEVEQGLISRFSIEPAIATSVALLAEGSITNALRMSNEDKGAQIEPALEFLRNSAGGRTKEIKAFIETELKEEGRTNAHHYLKYMILLLKDAAICGAFPADQVEPLLSLPAHRATLEKMSQRYSQEQLYSAIKECEEARLTIDYNVNIPLLFYALTIKIHRVLT